MNTKFDIGSFAYDKEGNWYYITEVTATNRKVTYLPQCEVDNEITYGYVMYGNLKWNLTKGPVQFTDFIKYKSEDELMTSKEFMDYFLKHKEEIGIKYPKDYDVYKPCENKSGYLNLALMDINDKHRSDLETTANCYVIKSVGNYKFPLVYGNGIVDGNPNPSAYTQKGNTETTQPFYNAHDEEITNPYINGAVSAEVVGNDHEEEFTLTDIVVADGYIHFTVSGFPKLGGNITLAVKDKDGKILWSWHLWACSEELTNVDGFLNRNLGWYKRSKDDEVGVNPHYQWGRKDPMLINCFVSESCAKSLEETIQHPNTFYIYEDENYNWWRKDGDTVNFFNYWNADCDSENITGKPVTKTIYDPCPVGFQMPCGSEWKDFDKNNGGEWKNGYMWNSRFFGAAGYRDYGSGGVSYVGSDGYYWSSAADGTALAYSLGFNSGYVNPRNYGYRAFGFSVAPVLPSE